MAAQLEHALRRRGGRRADLDAAYLSASALLASQQDTLGTSELGLRLLRALGTAPLHRLTPASMQLATLGWAWLVSGGSGGVGGRGQVSGAPVYCNRGGLSPGAL